MINDFYVLLCLEGKWFKVLNYSATATKSTHHSVDTVRMFFLGEGAWLRVQAVGEAAFANTTVGLHCLRPCLSTFTGAEAFANTAFPPCSELRYGGMGGGCG